MKRTTLLILIAIPLLVIAVVLVVLMQTREPDATNTNTVIPSGEITNATNTANSSDEARQLTEEEKQKNDIERIATIFTEQFGTFRGAFSATNLTALESIITPVLKEQLERSIKPATNDVEITTQVLFVNIATFTESRSSVVTAATLRSEESADGTTQVVSQELVLEMTYAANEWKVQAAQWKNPEEADVII